jgi:hypothetical protein
MITPIDVIDTAVKIGLGALISGAAGYWIAKLNHDREIEKDRVHRRRELLESVAEQVETFTQNALHYWAVLTDDTRRLEATPELLASFKELTSAESKLLLLGENECQKLVREYGEYVKGFREQFMLKGKLATGAEQKEFRENILSQRVTVFHALSAAYNRTRT